MDQIGQHELALFTRYIRQRTGIDLNLYKQEQVERRLKASLERAGAASLADFLTIIAEDPAAWSQFVDRLTINVSELFRNPEQFEILASQVLPDILSPGGSLRIWSAGCSYGAEPVSLAILVQERFPGSDLSILATDVDERVLDRAARGVFTESDMKNVSEQRRRRWFRQAGSGWQAGAILQRIRFARHNLLSDGPPGTFDLIACRNVSIYFSEAAKARAHSLLRRSLAPGGYIFIGSSELVANHDQLGLTNPYPFFYHLPDELSRAA